LAAVGALVVVAVEPAVSAPGPGKAHALFRVPTTHKIVALSFDDGPDPHWTPHVLDLLEAHGDHATFFQIGKNALAHKDLVARVEGTGNEIGNHTLDHAHLTQLTATQIRDEVSEGTDALVTAGAPTPVLFRPPLGRTNDRVADVTEAQGLRTVLWSACVEHYIDHVDVATGTTRLLDNIRPGMIILAHDGGIPNRTRTMQSLPMLLDGLDRLGYKVVTVSQLVAGH
jgi:peptidoglycan/xylan/chitin deacetylase (PgdA/CDA1 family)